MFRPYMWVMGHSLLVRVALNYMGEFYSLPNPQLGIIQDCCKKKNFSFLHYNSSTSQLRFEAKFAHY